MSGGQLAAAPARYFGGISFFFSRAKSVLKRIYRWDQLFVKNANLIEQKTEQRNCFSFSIKDDKYEIQLHWRRRTGTFTEARFSDSEIKFRPSKIPNQNIANEEL